MSKSSLRRMLITAMFIAMGMVLPFLTGQIPEIGSKLLPMHIPVLLCGLICGWQYGLACGAILPILRSFVFGMPPIYPKAIVYMFEFAIYGLIAGLLYQKVFKKHTPLTLYASLLGAMICGRVMYGLAYMAVLGVGDGWSGNGGFTMSMFISGAFLEAIPGIIAQLVLIPLIMLVLQSYGLVKFNEK